MSLLLHIDTSGDNASICLSENESCLCLLENPEQKGHAAWLHPAIMQALEHTGRTLQELVAVGVTAGPGSYTGLRVGMAAAKGLCYALQVPLVTINTLEAMAGACHEEKETLLCPMIDARRMEVFTAVYSHGLVPVVQPCAMIIDGQSFSTLLQEHNMCFFGNGKNKLAAVVQHENARYKEVIFNASYIAEVIYKKFLNFEFASLAYTELVYLKEHFTNVK